MRSPNHYAVSDTLPFRGSLSERRTDYAQVDYLIHPLPSYRRKPRVGAGAAIVAVYYALLIFVVATYIRLVYNVLWDPGYLPLGAERVQADSTLQDSKRSRKRRRRKSSSRHAGNTEKTGQSNVDLERGINAHAGGKAYQLDSAGLESFYMKDVFVCQEDGRPSYCSSCCQFKTDRAHHCREVDRCVRKMDHFCPWYVIKALTMKVLLNRLRVGGVVSETSFKFFIQFVVYTSFFCAFVLIVTAYYTAELLRNVSVPAC